MIVVSISMKVSSSNVLWLHISRTTLHRELHGMQMHLWKHFASYLTFNRMDFNVTKNIHRYLYVYTVCAQMQPKMAAI